MKLLGTLCTSAFFIAVAAVIAFALWLCGAQETDTDS